MKKKSAGILLLKQQNDKTLFFIVHPGGPFWSGRNKGAWSIPKGQIEDTESAFEAAKREWQEETSF